MSALDLDTDLFQVYIKINLRPYLVAFAPSFKCL